MASGLCQVAVVQAEERRSGVKGVVKVTSDVESKLQVSDGGWGGDRAQSLCSDPADSMTFSSLPFLSLLLPSFPFPLPSLPLPFPPSVPPSVPPSLRSSLLPSWAPGDQKRVYFFKCVC